MIACPTCDFIGYPADLNPAPVPDLRPGERYVAPWGKCPNCAGIIPHDAPELDASGASTKPHPRKWPSNPRERDNLTRFQRDCLLRALVALTPEHPGFTGSPEVALILSEDVLPEKVAAMTFGHCSFHLYVDSWVRPALEAALYGPAYHGQDAHMRADADRARLAMRGKAVQP